MTSFDSWEAIIRPSNDCLMHHGIKGMKHGRRRYQNEDGTWTETGLAERRKREGFGERRKARKEARKAARAERVAKRRANNPKYMSDEELQKRIAHLKLVNEYKDLNRSELAKQGAKLVNDYLEYRKAKEERVSKLNQQKIDLERIRSETVKATERTKQAKSEAKKALEDRKKMQADVRGGLAKERKKDLLGKKIDYKNYTIRGGIARRINMYLTSGKAKQYDTIRKAAAESAANRLKSDSARDLEKHKTKLREKDLKPEKKREEQLRKKRNKERKRYEKELAKIKNM